MITHDMNNDQPSTNSSEYYAPRVAILAFYFGVLGVHRFYTRRPVLGILQLLTLGGFGVWVLIDLILILVGSCKDDRGLPITRWNYEPSASNRLLLPAFLLNTLLGVFGVHRFYVGKIGTGLLQLFTLGGFGLWTLVDHFILAWGCFTDKAGNRVTRWT